MASTISVRVEKDILKELEKLEEQWQTDRSEAIRRLLVNALKEWKIQHALEELAKHKISIGKAAERAGISLWEMLELVKEKNIDWTGYNDEDLEQDLKLIR